MHERRLHEATQLCTAKGEEPYTILTYPDAAAMLLAVKEGRIDVLMNAASALRYMASQQDDLEFLGRYGLLDVGFGLKKGSPLAPALSAAVNKLIEDGVYARIIEKWELGDAAAVPRSEINPPERTP
jgi:polar amino acid transport system substrate-binding protein